MTSLRDRFGVATYAGGAVLLEAIVVLGSGLVTTIVAVALLPAAAIGAVANATGAVDVDLDDVPCPVRLRSHDYGPIEDDGEYRYVRVCSRCGSRDYEDVYPGL